jgi:imidazolonepropionase-like amidohydrolase
MLGYYKGCMPCRAVLALLALFLCACQPPEGSHSKAIIGAVLIDGTSAPPLSDSVVVVGDGRIRAVGRRSSVEIPPEADKIDGSARFLAPVVIDICESASPPGLIHPANPEEARAQVAEAAARKISIVHLGQTDRATVRAAMEAARAAGIPVTGHVSTEAGAKLLVENGATSLVGMIRDSEELDAAFVARLRNLQIVVAPALVNAGSGLAVASRNTRRLFQAGVPLAVASEGGDPIREMELLVEAGVPPLDAIVAATHNGALALHQLEERGTIEAGKRADLVLLSANPGEDIRNLRRVARRMVAGEWVR